MLVVGLGFVDSVCSTRYRQLSVVESALQSLGRDQQLVGSQMLLDYLHTNASTSTDKDFIKSLLQIGTSINWDKPFKFPTVNKKTV